MTEKLTYKEIAERFDIKLASARRLVMRKKWHKIKGNDGETRVSVPLEALERHDDKHDDKHDDNHYDKTIATMQAKIDGLEAVILSEKKRADAAEADRDRWHLYAVRPWWKRLIG